jgi:hypothetical protein
VKVHIDRKIVVCVKVHIDQIVVCVKVHIDREIVACAECSGEHKSTSYEQLHYLRSNTNENTNQRDKSNRNT